ncbi:hypothetical protein [Streptomyces lavendofoliae]|uniref:Secreted protein n=1 Tax=Streptomyces lavendofoliae TaxID=67314 RepID=A0A918I5I5_9ACTN|nr:hypothetical protein [Streptomyces lavendofoliae]GGU64023.1 hypothetical protein GCM10010274_60890 [Streptomyces lavendofoliae]
MRRRRTAALAAATAVLALTTAVGCGALDKAMDCVQAADAIATSVDRLGRAVSTATGDPTRLNESLDEIDRELDSLKGKTDNADLSKAVDDLGRGVESVRAAVRDGDTTPDIKPVTDAATEIGKVCTP